MQHKPTNRLEQVMDLLRMRKRPMTFYEVADDMGVSRPKAFEFLKILCEVGAVRRIKSDVHYREPARFIPTADDIELPVVKMRDDAALHDAVMEALSALGRPSTVAETAAKMGKSHDHVYTIMKTLRRHGLVSRDKSGSRWVYSVRDDGRPVSRSDSLIAGGTSPAPSGKKYRNPLCAAVPPAKSHVRTLPPETSLAGGQRTSGQQQRGWYGEDAMTRGRMF